MRGDSGTVREIGVLARVEDRRSVQEIRAIVGPSAAVQAHVHSGSILLRRRVRFEEANRFPFLLILGVAV